MSLARRLEMLQRADTDNSWIIEDDYDSEFRYDAQPIASLQGWQTAHG
jgi:GntR family transcriptional regulator/MocR family aminotransferase